MAVRNEIKAKMDEILSVYRKNDVGFQELKDTIMFGEFSMGDIVNMYAELSYKLDGDLVVRVDEDMEEGTKILEQFGYVY